MCFSGAGTKAGHGYPKAVNFNKTDHKCTVPINRTVPLSRERDRYVRLYVGIVRRTIPYEPVRTAVRYFKGKLWAPAAPYIFGAELSSTRILRSASNYHPMCQPSQDFILGMLPRERPRYSEPPVF
jgi:hypothetical protein